MTEDPKKESYLCKVKSMYRATDSSGALIPWGGAWAWEMNKCGFES